MELRKSDLSRYNEIIADEREIVKDLQSCTNLGQVHLYSEQLNLLLQTKKEYEHQYNSGDRFYSTFSLFLQVIKEKETMEIGEPLSEQREQFIESLEEIRNTFYLFKAGKILMQPINQLLVLVSLDSSREDVEIALKRIYNSYSPTLDTLEKKFIGISNKPKNFTADQSYEEMIETLNKIHAGKIAYLISSKECFEENIKHFNLTGKTKGILPLTAQEMQSILNNINRFCEENEGKLEIDDSLGQMYERVRNKLIDLKGRKNITLFDSSFSFELQVAKLYKDKTLALKLSEITRISELLYEFKNQGLTSGDYLASHFAYHVADRYLVDIVGHYTSKVLNSAHAYLADEIVS